MSYTGLAGVYDSFAYDFDYDEWTERYLQLLTEQNPQIKELCDCGCGTGSIAIRLKKRGFNVTGIDLSEEMLAEAQRKARRSGVKIPFIRQDMREIQLPHRVDGIFAACDGVNYLLTEADVRRFFEAAHAGLKPGGAFAFDISSIEKLSDSGFYGEELEEQAYMWQNSYDEEKRLLTMKLCLFVMEPDGRYIKRSETHVQKAHKKHEITALLKDAGFCDVMAFGEDYGEADKRIYFSAKRG